MFRRWLLIPCFGPEDAGSGGGEATGTTDNVAASVTSGAAEPSTSGNITSGTASDAMIKAAMAASSAEDTTTTGVQAGIVVPQKPVSETTDPTKDAKGPQAPASQRGEAPQSRIEAAVKNARAAAVAETRKEYAWAEGVTAEGGKVAIDITRQLASDPKTFATELATELGFKLVPINDPAAGEPPKPVAGDPKRPFPKGKLRSEDGLEAYSADQMPEIVAIISDQLRAEMQGHIQPLMDDRKHAAEIRTQETIRQEARASVRSTMDYARKLPHFQIPDGKGGTTDHPQILKNLEAIPKAERVAMGPKAALLQAYNQYLNEVVFPHIDTEAEKRIRANWGKKAATSMGSGHPVTQGGDGKPTELRGVSDLARHMERLAAAQTG